MNKGRLLFFFVLLMMCIKPAIAQKSSQKVKDSLHLKINEYFKLDSFEKYYATLRILEDLYVENSEEDSLYTTNDKYNYLPKSKEDSLVLRKALTFHAFVIRKYLGDYNSSLFFYKKAHDYASDKILLDVWVWHVELILGNIHARMNEYDKSLYYYQLCLPYLQSVGDKQKLSRLYANIGDVYRWLNDEKNMNESYQLGLSLAKEVQEYKALQAINENISEYYLSKRDFSKFMFYWQESYYHVQNNIAAEDKAGRKSSLDILLGDYYYEIGKFQNAINKYSEVLVIYDQIHQKKLSREHAKIWHKIAKVNLASENLTACNLALKCGFEYIIPNYSGSEIPTDDQISRENTFTDLLDLKAAYYYKLYNKSGNILFLDSALTAIEIALFANKKLDQYILLNNSKFQSLKVNKELVSKAIEYCFVAYNKSKLHKYKYKSRAFLNISKSMLLLENQKEQLLVKSISEDDKVQINLLELKLINLQKQKLEGNFESQKEIVRNQQKIVDIMKKYNTSKVKYNRIKLPYVEYIKTEKEYYLYSNLSEEKLIKLGSVDMINKKIERLSHYLKNKNLTELDILLEDLYKLLLPINLGIINKLVIIPDGELAFVPFDILRCEGKYLFEQKIVQMQFHHDVIVNNEKPPKKMSIYCLSPTYEKPELPLMASLERGEFNYLHYAKKEVGLLKKMFGRRMEIDSLLTIELLKNKIKNSQIFHFSGHAVVDRDSAFLLLSDENENLFKLYQDQIAYMSNDLEMVTLSACETGLGKYQSGEGVISLAASFLNSGSKSIIYSLWNAHDASTSEVMKLYYENLKNGLAKDEALNKAKKEFLALAPPDQRHPYYWAAFVVAGDMSPIQFHSNSIYWYVAIIVFLVILGYIFYKNKTKQT